MFLGKIKASLIPLVSFVAGVGSIIVCYILSQIYHHEKPFPDTWISATADHYPEFVVFRVGTIAGAVFMTLSHFIVYYWVMTVGYEKVFNIGKHKPEIGTVMGIAGCLFLMGSTSTLDTGKHNTNWHVFCAVDAFGWQIFSSWYHTYICWVLYKNTKAISFGTTITKMILSLAMLIQVYADLKYSSGSKRLGNILEYTLAFSVFAFYLLMVIDLRDFKLSYKQKISPK